MRDPQIDPQSGDILRKNGRMVLVDAAFDDYVHLYPLDNQLNYSMVASRFKIPTQEIAMYFNGAEVVRVGWPENDPE